MNYVACVGIKDVSFLFVLLLLMFFPAIAHCAISRNFITSLFRKSMVEFVFIKANINQIERHCNIESLLFFFLFVFDYALVKLAIQVT